MTTRACRVPEVTKAKIRKLHKEGIPRWALMERFGLTQNDLIPILRKKV
jgi:hypothetical protein